ncbi:MAG: hypothetical protein KAG98_05070, partial [Lentisphaeria bacterium]|nr:hypothetical protein [Lentisphaeria bacterium]
DDSKDTAVEPTKKKVPQLKKGAGKKTTGKKITTGAKKSATNDKFKNIASSVKKPDALANAKKTSNSSLHTHLNKTDQHGVSHKDRIEEELRLQVKRIKKIMALSVAALIGLIFVIWLIIKIVGWASSDVPVKNSTNSRRSASYFKLETDATKYSQSKRFDPKKFDKVFENFYNKSNAANKARAVELKAKLLKERANNK